MSQNPTIKGAALVLLCMALVAFSDNFVRFFSDVIGLWQFHLMRAILMCGATVLLARYWGVSLVPAHWGYVMLRSFLLGSSMMLYFGALGNVSVAIAGAGLFLAPVFMVIFSVMLFRTPVGIFRIMAVLLGFAGVLVILRPFGTEVNAMAFMPVVGAVFYALALLVTNHYCKDEATITVVFWFFAAMGVYGAAGLVVVYLFGFNLTQETGFLTHGFAMPWGMLGVWIILQGAISIVALTAQTKAYQIADASILSVYEYSFLIFGAFWGWVFWRDTLGLYEVLGMAMIVIAGVIIAIRHKD